MSLSLFWTSGRANEMRAELLYSALPFSRSCQRSGRSPALPYPLHEFLYFTTLPGGLIFVIKMGQGNRKVMNLIFPVGNCCR